MKLMKYDRFYESDKEAAMSLLQAILMGIIQGLTEFLPVSSSGHLALFKILFDVNTDTGILYDVLLHVGTLIAISLVYYRDILKLVVDGCCIIRDAGYNVIVFFRNKTGKEQMAYRRVINSSYPQICHADYRIDNTDWNYRLFLQGCRGDGFRDSDCSRHLPYRNGSAAFDRGSLQGRRQTSEERHLHGCVFCRNRTGNRNASGLSRSGTTITACLLAGYQRNFAVKYSFLMSIPAILGALVLELKDATDLAVSGTEVVYYVIGMAVAAVVGYVCIKTMLVIVRKKKFTVFAIYCLLVGALSIGGYFYLA